MTTDVCIKLVSSILTIIVTIISAYLVPWLKTKITDSQLQQIDKYIELAVRCAEQIYTPEEWAEKKEYVLTYMIELVNDKYSIKLTPADLDLMIEGVVNQVKNK